MATVKTKTTKFWQYQVLEERRTIATFIQWWLHTTHNRAASTLKNSLAMSCSVKHTQRPSNSLSCICPKEMKTSNHTQVSYSCKNCTQITNTVTSSIIHNYQILERTQMSASLWIDEQIVVHPYNGLLLSRKIWPVDRHHMQPQRYHMHYKTWEKPDSKLYIPFIWLHLFLKKPKAEEQKSKQYCQDVGMVGLVN